VCISPARPLERRVVGHHAERCISVSSIDRARRRHAPLRGTILIGTVSNKDRVRARLVLPTPRRRDDLPKARPRRLHAFRDRIQMRHSVWTGGPCSAHRPAVAKNADQSDDPAAVIRGDKMRRIPAASAPGTDGHRLPDERIRSARGIKTRSPSLAPSSRLQHLEHHYVLRSRAPH